MLPKVLFVDDDRVLLHRIQKKSEAFKNSFQLLMAENGRQAVDMLRTHGVSLTVTDLHMPEMDGFELLAFMSEHYPEIPVIIQTGYGTPDSKRSALCGGAAAYIEKPIDLDKLMEKICAMLAETLQSETFQSVPLELFSHLIVSEKRTCTLRVVNRKTEQHGALFFEAGLLLDARARELSGKEAAREIYRWSQTIYAIQNACPIEDCKIDGGIQAVLPDFPICD